MRGEISNYQIHLNHNTKAEHHHRDTQFRFISTLSVYNIRKITVENAIPFFFRKWGEIEWFNVNHFLRQKSSQARWNHQKEQIFMFKILLNFANFQKVFLVKHNVFLFYAPRRLSCLDGSSWCCARNSSHFVAMIITDVPGVVRWAAKPMEMQN